MLYKTGFPGWKKAFVHRLSAVSKNEEINIFLYLFSSTCCLKTDFRLDPSVKPEDDFFTVLCSIGLTMTNYQVEI